jgi:hypothetical protein
MDTCIPTYIYLHTKERNREEEGEEKERERDGCVNNGTHQARPCYVQSAWFRHCI